jgi:hypothetical protein
VDDETRQVSAAVRPTVQLLTAPSSFTLAAGGVLAVIIGRHGYPGILPIWLFVAGGCAAFCLTALMSKANGAQSPHARPAAGRAAFNLVPLAVLPIVCAVTSVVPAAGLAFPAAGFLTVILYVAGYSGLAALARQHARPEQGRAGHDGQRGDRRGSPAPDPSVARAGRCAAQVADGR